MGRYACDVHDFFSGQKMAIVASTHGEKINRVPRVAYIASGMEELLGSSVVLLIGSSLPKLQYQDSDKLNRRIPPSRHCRCDAGRA